MRGLCPKVLEPGRYRAVIVAADQEDASRSSGCPYVAVEYELPDHDVWVSEMYSLQPWLVWRFRRLLVCTRLMEYSHAGPFDFHVEDLVGKAVTLTLGVHHSRFGPPRNVVTRVGGVPRAPAAA